LGTDVMRVWGLSQQGARRACWEAAAAKMAAAAAAAADVAAENRMRMEECETEGGDEKVGSSAGKIKVGCTREY